MISIPVDVTLRMDVILHTFQDYLTKAYNYVLAGIKLIPVVSCSLMIPLSNDTFGVRFRPMVQKLPVLNGTRLVTWSTWLTVGKFDSLIL